MEEILGATLTSTSTSTTSFMVDNRIRTDGRITWTSTTTSSTTPTTPADREAEGSVNEEALLVEDDEYEEDLEAWETSFPNATAGVEDTSGGQPWDEDQWVELRMTFPLLKVPGSRQVSKPLPNRWQDWL